MSGEAMRAASPPAPLIEARGLTIVARASGKVLVEEMNLSLHAGEALALVGESGSGKSLSALALLGLLPPSVALVAGKVLVEGYEVTGLEGRHEALRGRSLAMIFQDPQSCLDPRWTVERYLTGQFRRLRDMGRGEALRAASELLERVGLSNPGRILKSYPHELSGGMAQRVMIAGALAGDPRVLVADEPTTALDVTTQAQILDLLDDLRRDRGLGLLVITHDFGVVGDVSDRVLVLYGGRVMETGATESILDRPTHPYTRALLAAMPDISNPTPPRPIPGIPGRPDGDTACPFHLRCGFAFDACGRAAPDPVPRPDGEGVAACHLDIEMLAAEETALLREAASWR